MFDLRGERLNCKIRWAHRVQAWLNLDRGPRTFCVCYPMSLSVDEQLSLSSALYLYIKLFNSGFVRDLTQQINDLVHFRVVPARVCVDHAHAGKNPDDDQ